MLPAPLNSGWKKNAGGVRWCRWSGTDDTAENPAAGVVFEAPDASVRRWSRRRWLTRRRRTSCPSSGHWPVSRCRGNRWGRRRRWNGAAVAPAHPSGARVARLVTHAEVGSARSSCPGVVLPGGVELGLVRQKLAEPANLGLPAGTTDSRRLLGDALVDQVVALADQPRAGARPRLGVDQAALHRRVVILVGVGDAVAAGMNVLGENLREVEIQTGPCRSWETSTGRGTARRGSRSAVRGSGGNPAASCVALERSPAVVDRIGSGRLRDGWRRWSPAVPQ